MGNMFKVNNKVTRTTPLFIVNFEHIWTIANFELVNAGWLRTLWRICNGAFLRKGPYTYDIHTEEGGGLEIFQVFADSIVFQK